MKPEEIVEDEPEDVVSVLDTIRSRYFDRFPSSGTEGVVAGILWDHLLAWKRGGRRMPLRRAKLRALVQEEGLNVTDGAVDKALQSFAMNLSAFSNDDGGDNVVVGGPDELTITILGPTGNDRGDRQRDSLWLLPLFARAERKRTAGFFVPDAVGDTGITLSIARVTAQLLREGDVADSEADEELIGYLRAAVLTLYGPGAHLQHQSSDDPRADPIERYDSMLKIAETDSPVAYAEVHRDVEGVALLAFFAVTSPVAFSDVWTAFSRFPRHQVQDFGVMLNVTRPPGTGDEWDDSYLERMDAAIHAEFTPEWSGTDRHRIELDDGLCLEIITIPWLHFVFYTDDPEKDLYEAVDRFDLAGTLLRLMRRVSSIESSTAF